MYQELRLRMRESFVMTGTYDSKMIGMRRGMRKEVRDFQARLTVLAERALGTKHHRLFELSVLKVFVAKAGRGMLSMQLVEERFGIKPKRLIGDTAYGTAEMLAWMVEEKDIGSAQIAGGIDPVLRLPPLPR